MPPPVKPTVPVCTSMLPVLLKNRAIVVTRVPTVFLNRPALLNWEADPPRLKMKDSLFWGSKVANLGQRQVDLEHGLSEVQQELNSLDRVAVDTELVRAALGVDKRFGDFTLGSTVVVL